MKVEEPIASGDTPAKSAVSHLRHYIMERVETETDLAMLERIYSIISSRESLSFREKYSQAKIQTEKYCTSDMAAELEAEGYMIDKDFPYADEPLDIETLIAEDESDDNAPKEWIEKMFPEVYA